MATENLLRSGVLRVGALVRAARGDSLVRNSLYIMATTIVTSVLGYGYWIAATHLYPTRVVGLASALISAIILASTLSNLGLTMTLIHALPRRTSGASWSLTLNSALLAAFVTGLVGGGGLLLVLPAVSPQFSLVVTSPLVGIVVLATVPLWTVTTLLDFTFIAERAASYMLLRNSAFAILKIPIMVTWIAVVGATTLGILASWGAAAIVSLGVGLIGIMSLGREYRLLAARGALAQVRQMLGTMTANYVTSLGGSVPAYALPTLVAIRLSATDTAYFYTTWMLGSLFFMVSLSVSNSFYAEGSNARGHVAGNLTRSIRLIVLLLTPIALAYLLGGRYVLSVFGPAYAAHGLVLLYALTVAVVPDAITNLYVASMRVEGNFRYAAALNVFMAIVTLVAAWFLLPPFGVTGGGLAWLLGQGAGSIAVGVHMGIRKLYLESRQFRRLVGLPEGADEPARGD